MKKNLLLWMLSFLALCQEAIAAIPISNATDGQSSLAYLTYRIEQNCSPQDTMMVELPGLTLHADSGSVIKAFTLSAERLPSTEAVAPMPSGMVNVTSGRAIYRLLPHGEHFNEPAILTMEYDPILLPHGYKPKDIYTCYYDTLAGRWIQLPRVTMDTLTHTIVSLTTHFTDFANAIIKVPEMPETKAFVPTMMQDLPDIDPLDQIPMIAVPEANNNGTAELTYPIFLPQGRNGMQPSLALTYSSSNTGNGPLGVGWSLNIPAITIDTRWGVPRYDIKYETEAYTLNGQSLVMHEDNGQAVPLPHQSDHFEQRTLLTRRFYARDTRNQDKIIRHGRNPKEYWWSVTDRQGVTTYYGGIFDPNHPEDMGLDTTTVLYDANKNIGYWAITAVIDLYGNYIRYNYIKDGNNLYPSSITYTGNYKEPLLPAYSVDFVWRNRTDVTSEARLGFMRRTNKLLCHLRCVYDNIPFRIYAMRYQEPEQSTMFKSRLAEVMQIDSCTHHLIEYYGTTYGCINLDELDAQPWPGTRTQFSYEDAPSSSELFSTQPVNYPSENNYISRSRSTAWDIGGTLSVGLGPNVALTTMSIGGNYSYNRSDGQIQYMLMDINGDGLPDQVYEQNGNVWYRKQILPHGFAPPEQVIGLNRLSHEVSETNSWGVQLDAIIANISGSWPVTDSYTDTYFADVNGDGLPDLVTPEGIRFNTLDNNGHPNFSELYDTRTTSQENTTITVNNSVCGQITLNGEVDRNLLCSLSYDEKDPILFHTLFSEDYDWVQWSDENFNGASFSPGAHFFQEMNPDIQCFYVDDKIYCKNVISTTCNRENVNPNIEVARVWVAPHNGTVNITSTLRLEPDNSESHAQSQHADGVICYIQKSSGIAFTGSKISSSTDVIIARKAIADKDSTISTLNKNFVSVQKGDVLLFRVYSRENTDYDRVRWTQQINYTDFGLGIYNSAIDYICIGENDFVAPYNGTARASFVCHNDNGTNVNLRVLHYRNRTALKDTSIVVHGNTSDTLNYIPADIAAGDTITFWLSGNTSTTWSNVHAFPDINFSSDSFGQGERIVTYYPDIHIQGISTNPPFLPPYSGPTLDFGYPLQELRSLFGGTLHRGWGQFAYNWSESPYAGDTILHLSGLYNTSDSTLRSMKQNHTQDSIAMVGAVTSIDTLHFENYNSQSIESITQNLGIYTPISSIPWVEMTPDSRTERYIAYGHMGCISRDIQANTRQTDAMITYKDTLYQSYTTTQTEIITYDSPFPKTGANGRLTTIRKSSRTEQDNLSYGIGYGPLSLAHSQTSSVHTVETDYMDLNGDGFPDFIGKVNGIQYSTPWGGIGNLKITDMQPFVTVSSSEGRTFSASHSADPKQIAGNGQSSTHYTIKVCPGNVGINAGGSTGSNSARHAYMDINGDGLPDKIDVTAHTVAFNLGYSFANPVSFASLCVSDGTNIAASGGANVGGGAQWLNDIKNAAFSAAQVSLSGGVNVSNSEDHTDQRLFDINGDGLPDLLTLAANNTVNVHYNIGGQFSTPETVNLTAIMTNHSDNIGVNIGVTGGFTLFLIVKFCLGVQSTPWSQSISQSTGDLIDMNGDGYPDWVETSSNGLSVRYHQGARTNLLKTIINPTGQRIELDYTLSEPDSRHRQRQWNLTQVTDSDRLNPNSELQARITEMHYANPHYDNYERTDYGYRVVTSETGNKRLTQTFQNESYIQHGEKTSDLLSDTAGVKYLGHRYSKGFFQGGDPDHSIDTLPGDLCQDADIHIQYDGDWTDWYEGQSTPQLSMLTQSFYDSLYNLTRFMHHGNYALPGDEWTQDITYSTSAIHRRHHLISLPMRERVCGGGQTLRLSDAEYNHYGSIERIDMHDTASSVILSTRLIYDSVGHLVRAIYPTGMQLDITYDTDVQTYPASVSNSFNETTLTDYDMRWGRPIRTTDPANNVIYYDYDVSGRLVSVLAPFESVAGLNHTVEYLYHNRGHRLNHSYQETDSFTHVIKVMHSAYSIQPDTELVIYDARGKELQRKRKITVGSNLKWISSGKVKLDCFYRPNEQNFPCEVGAALIQDFDTEVCPTCAPTYTYYDVLDRPTRIDYPDLASEFRDYSVQDNALYTLLTDANGNTQQIFKSPQDWTLRTREGADSMTIYQYNPIGELIRVTDAEGYRTDYTYDMFGHTLTRSHPDNGTTRWFYDSDGLLAAMQTQRLYNNNQTIDYKYDRGRLTDVITPYSASIHYDYNSAGRISKRWDASGTEEYTYDALGNISRSIRRLAVPTENDVYVFQTDYLYDSYGRMQLITYPDGEQVNYHYGVGGMLSDVVSNIYDTICERQYNERGQRIYQKYGNNIETYYDYSPLRNWLTDLTLRKNSILFSEKYYTFDPVGNVASTTISEGTSPAFAAWTTNFYYDNRNRLVQAHDPYDYGVAYSPTCKMWRKKYNYPIIGSVSQEFDLYYGYDADTISHQPRVIYDDFSHSAIDLYWDADGNLAQMIDCDRNKVRLHRWNDFDRLTLSLGHDFCGYYGYDADGIRTYKLMGTCNISTQNGGGLQAQAIFDDMVLYPSPYMVVTPRGYTNHYYAGSERIASRVGNLCWSITPTAKWEKPAPEFDALEDFEGLSHEIYPFGVNADFNLPTTNTTPIYGYEEKVQYSCTPVELPGIELLYQTDMLQSTINCEYSGQGEAPAYYYHSDHLGSTSWVTDFKGNEHQFLAYLPYGEPLLDVHFEHYDSRYGQDDARYKFTGKERDWETGYDYMEQRYYWWPGGFWLRPDPLLDKYIHLSPYAYCNGNPLKYVDPDGEDWYEDGGEIRWTDCKSQQAMDKAKLVGRYLGEAVVSFNGYYDEALGKGNNLWGEGAKLATATVYGPGGSDDIATYDAFTMSSNYNEYGAIKNGDYSLNYVEATGPMGTHWTINNREAVDCINDYNTAWYKHKETNPYSATQKNRTYVHRCNLNGDMLPLGKDGLYHPLSTGCLIIAPSRNGKPGWNEFNNQLQGVKKAFLRLTRQ